MKYIFLILFTLLSVHSTFGYVLQIPQNKGESDYNVPLGGGDRVDGREEDIYRIVDFINENLWFSLAVVGFIAVVYSGIKFAMGGSESVNILKSLLQGLGGGLLLAVFSYAILRILVNLI